MTPAALVRSVAHDVLTGLVVDPAVTVRGLSLDACAGTELVLEIT